MKKLKVLLIILISFTISKAQKIPVNIYANAEGHPIIYSASSGNSNFLLGLTIDANTKWIEYHNQLPNQPLTNYVFLKGTKKVGLSATIPIKDVKKYRYNITEDDSVYLATNLTPNISSKLSNGRANINLGTFDIENKKLTIETYKISERNKVSTSIIYNKEIRPAALSFITLGVTNAKAESVVMMKPQKDGFSFKIHDSDKKTTVNSVVFCVKPSDQTFLYNVYIKNLSSGKTSFVSNNWLYDYFFSGWANPIPYIKIDASFFEAPGNYEISIIPKLPSGFHIKSFPDKTTTIHWSHSLVETMRFQRKTFSFYKFYSSIIMSLSILSGAL